MSRGRIELPTRRLRVKQDSSHLLTPQNT